MLGERGLWFKMTFFEGSSRVPLMIAAPQMAPGLQTTPVSTIDVCPTLCDLAGQCGILRLPLFLFQEGADRLAQDTFRSMARLSGGAWARFDAGSAARARASSRLSASRSTRQASAVAGPMPTAGCPARRNDRLARYNRATLRPSTDSTAVP